LPDNATDAVTPEGTNLARRRFFRQFAGEVVQNAATVVGAAQALRDTSAQAAAAILDPASMAPSQAEYGTSPAPEARPPAGFRSPFRFGDRTDVLLVVDQRRLPDALVEFEVRSAVDAAAALRDRVVSGAPAVAQVAALGLALTAHRARAQRPHARRANVRGAANALRSARPTVIAVEHATDRLLRRFEEVGGVEADGDVVAEALRVEADTIVWEATNDHGRIADAGVAELPRREAGELRLLTHGSTGALASGQFGTALGIVLAAHNAAWPLHVSVTEAGPHREGRIAAWELMQAGVAHDLVPDVAAGALIAEGRVDAVLVGATAIAANGDTANDAGTYALAVLAQRHAVPFLVAAPLATVAPVAPDGAALTLESRDGSREADVTPAGLITALLTDEGALTASAGSLADALARRAARRAIDPGPPWHSSRD
jgi:methylthioribose-1-phosphate isomerase